MKLQSSILMAYMQFLRTIIRESLIKNALFMMSTNLSNAILGFLFWVIASRYYTANEVGIISALLSSMFLIAMISSLGFPISLVFFLPRNKENASKIINSCIVTSTIVSLIASFVFIAGIDIWAPSLKQILGNLEFALLFAMVATGSTVSYLISSTLIAGNKSSYHMNKEIVFGFVKILPLSLIAWLGPEGILLSWSIGLGMALVVGFIFLSKVWKGYIPMLSLDPIIKSVAGYSAGNYFAGIFSALPQLLLPLIMVNQISAESTGFFFIAMMVAQILYGVPQSISYSLLVESTSAGDLFDKVSKAIRFNIALVVPGILLFTIFGKFVLNLFNPELAQNAWITLIILAVASLPMSLISIFTAVRNSQKRVESVIKINLGIAVITLALAVPLIGMQGINGAALAYLIANIAAAVVVIYRIKDPIEFISKLFQINKEG